MPGELDRGTDEETDRQDRQMFCGYLDRLTERYIWVDKQAMEHHVI